MLLSDYSSSQSDSDDNSSDLDEFQINIDDYVDKSISESEDEDGHIKISQKELTKIIEDVNDQYWPTIWSNHTKAYLICPHF